MSKPELETARGEAGSSTVSQRGAGIKYPPESSEYTEEVKLKMQKDLLLILLSTALKRVPCLLHGMGKWKK